MYHNEHEASQSGEGDAVKGPVTAAHLPKNGTQFRSWWSNPMFRAMRRHMESGDWERSSLLLDSLLAQYPQDGELSALRRQLHLRLQLAQRSYANDPLYRAMQRHVEKEKWEPALAMAESLLARYPQESELLSLRQTLQQQTDVYIEKRSRKWLFAALGLLSFFLISVCGLFYQYLREPVPLAQMFAPRAGLNYPPHYLFSIYEVAEPSGVAVLSNGKRIYVAEMAGERMVRIFDRNGKALGAFAPRDTQPGERAPVYLSTDSADNVYVTDRLQHAVFIFDRDGIFIDALLGPDLTLSEYVNRHAPDQSTDVSLTRSAAANRDDSTLSEAEALHIAPFQLPEWSPLGIRIDNDDRLILTDVAKDRHRIVVVMLSQAEISDFNADFDPLFSSFGASGKDHGQFLFPNAAVADSLERIYVSDGNNGRISVWSRQGNFLYDFGGGSGESSLSLPRGLAIDDRDRLHVVDTVGQTVKVYDVSGNEPEYLFAFGDFGLGDGLFNYPGDIAMDDSGRLYIADRENNRVQVWSY